MGWHIDDIIYHPEQIEVVFTLENTSDCCTIWRPHDQPSLSSSQLSKNDHHDSRREHQKYDLQSTQTTPNSALIIKAGGVEHKVSPLTVGKRTILKMAFVRELAVMDESMEGHASHHNNKKKAQRRSKSGKGVDTAKRR